MPTEQQTIYRVPEARFAHSPDSGDSAYTARLWLRQVLSATGSKGGTRIWSLADQSVVSLGNFLTNVILARKLAPHEFGMYAILWSIVFFVYGAHGALVTYPLSIRGATTRNDGLTQLTTFCLWTSGGIGLAFGAALAIVCLLLERFSLGLCCAAALLLLLIQETLRKAMMAHLRFGESLIGDALSYLGQAAVVLLLSATGRLSPATAFLAMGSTSLLAAGLQIVQLKIRSLYVTGVWALLADFWSLGRWMLLNSVAGIFSTQLFAWLLVIIMGAAATGTFQALINILGAANPIMLGAVNVILPTSAKAWREGGMKAASHVAFRHGSIAGMVLCPFLVVAMVLPGRILGLFYGVNSSYVIYETTLRILILATAVNYVAVIVSTVVNAVEQSRITFVVLIVSAVCSLCVGVPLTLWRGLEGAAVSMLVGGVIRAVMITLMMRRAEVDVVGAR